MDNINDLQNEMRNLLSAYIHKGAQSRSDMLLSFFIPFRVRKNIATKITHMHNTFIQSIPSCDISHQSLKIDLYRGDVPEVIEMMEYLRRDLPDDIAGAYIHGSLGTGEEIAYSDFDALVILKNSVFESSRKLMQVAEKLRDSLKIMYKFDPLQHHGWFVLTEAELQYYDESYFPSILFGYSRSLLEKEGRVLQIKQRSSSIDGKSSFDRVAASLLIKLDIPGYPKNIYQLKSMLSEFMLLPALFVQACNGKGIFKKDSFVSAEYAIKSANWDAMQTASDIRNEWLYELSPRRKWLMTRAHPFRNHVVNRVAPPIPAVISARLDESFFMSMRGLIKDMQEYFF